MCHDRSWFVSQEKRATERKPETADKRSEAVNTLLRESNDQAQKSTERAPAKEPAPAK